MRKKLVSLSQETREVVLTILQYKPLIFAMWQYTFFQEALF
jgi:hypothetical protein